MAGDVESFEEPIEAAREAYASDSRLADRVATLEDQLAVLRREFDDFPRSFQ